ncbi:damage-inducible protein DinB [Deinococcus taeanensis]|uniref:damage-inducible protein DinB n=1 Tax=Deinococcus taeanensis TaxID=2737050 RepID=UPI001CDD3DBC|nr:damage-inducible protein DinB [Deinococcus taeanensis]UBV43598.1 damage-inducible protein DinB [Deinococcus taeanensis]
MNVLHYSLRGGAAFRDVDALLHGLNWAEASAAHPDVPFTLAALLWHLQVTQRVSLDLASGRAERWPDDLNLWPDEPLSEAEFTRVLRDLQAGLAEAQMLAQDPSSRARDVLTDLAVHSAYHWGQVALLRRLSGTLPGPQGNA